MNVFYEGIVKAFEDGKFLVLDVYQPTEKYLADKLLTRDAFVQNKRIPLKDKIYAIKILADNLKDYLKQR